MEARQAKVGYDCKSDNHAQNGLIGQHGQCYADGDAKGTQAASDDTKRDGASKRIIGMSRIPNASDSKSVIPTASEDGMASESDLTLIIANPSPMILRSEAAANEIALPRSNS